MARGLARTSSSESIAASKPAISTSFAIHPGHVRALLWLRWHLTLRRFTRSWRRALGMIVGLVFVVWIGSSVGALSAAGYILLPRPAATQILFGVLALLYIVWAVLPLLQYTLNEGLDVTKLQTYPVTHGEQMVSLVLATAFDFSSIFIIAVFIAIIAGWHATVLATILTVVALGLAYIHIVGLSQLILAALMGLLRSRRYSDLTVIFFALVGSSCWLINQIILSRLDTTLRTTRAEDIARLHIDTYAQWLPPGMAARVIAYADAGSYLQALPWLAALAALVPVVLYLWSRVLERGLTMAEAGGVAPGDRAKRALRRAAHGTATASAGTGRLASEPRAADTERAAAEAARFRLIPGPARAIAHKDLRILWRDPQLKSALLSTLVPILLVFLPGLFASGHSSEGRLQISASSASGVLFAPLPALLIVLILSINAFGLERQGLQTLFLFPVRPRDIFLGKNLVVGGIAIGAEVVLVAVKAAITGGWGYVPAALAGGIAAVLVMLGCGNVTSVLAPFPSRQMRMGDTSSMAAEGGCLRSVLSTAILVVTAIILVPVAVAIILPLMLRQGSWLLVTIPLALVYGVVLYIVPTWLTGRMLLARAPEIIAVTVREA